MTYEELQQRRQRIEAAFWEAAGQPSTLEQLRWRNLARALLDDAALPLKANRDNTFAQGEYSRALSIAEKELGL